MKVIEFNEPEWTCTDPYNDQWGRQISWAGFQFKTRDSEPVIIDLTKYNKKELYSYLSSYYKGSLEEIEKDLGESYAWTVAECIYETDFKSN